MAKKKSKKSTNHVDNQSISPDTEATSKDIVENAIPEEDVADNTYTSENADTIDDNILNNNDEKAVENTVPDVIIDIDENKSSDEESEGDEGEASEVESEVDEVEASEIESEGDEGEASTTELCNDIEALKKKKKRKILIRSLRIIFTIGFFVFVALFLDEVLIQPYKMKNSIEKAKDLYNFETSVPTIVPEKTLSDNESDNNQSQNSASDSSSIDNATPTPTPDPNRDEMGRLRKFGKLLEVNEDVKGWIRLDNINGENDTKIDYVVVQSDISEPEYYLEKDWATHEYLKAGSIFLDSTSSVERGSKNLIIHGHNMTSSDDMFHYLLKYNELDFLKEHPLISFDTIYEEALWKVFSVYITPGNNDRDDFFPFVKTNFTSDRDFMEYIYQIRVRSLFSMDDIDINEEDQILTLSTCSYELKNYRTIIVARKVRPGEDPAVNTDNFEKREDEEVLYASSFYWRYGGKAPKVPSFDVALEDGLISWYNPMSRKSNFD